MIEGAAILLVGIIIGWRGRRTIERQRPDRGEARPKVLCSCGDPLSVHDPETKECQAEHLVKYNDLGMKRLQQCPCRRYDGPEPLPEFYAPEIGA